MTKPLSRTALKFLSLADQGYQGVSHGTHAYNLGAHFGPLSDSGYVTTDRYPFVHLTPKGRDALRAYYADGGLPGGKRVAARKVG